MPGEYYVSYNNEMLTTVLGSCIAVCCYDPKTPIGGMNHFLLPDGADDGGGKANDCLRYGSYAMEQLVNDLMRNGAKRERLVFKLFGGSDIPGIRSSVGQQNSQFIKKYLSNEGFRWNAEDLGGQYPRWLRFHPLTGKAQVKHMPVADSRQICESEKRAKKKAGGSGGSGGSSDLELF